MATTLHLIELQNCSIFEQLQLEEALLRGSDQNYCILNHGTTPAIVMGISGKPEKLIHLDRLITNSIPLIKRFSGGGTVVVDHNTLFITFILNKSTVPQTEFPCQIMKWTEKILKPAFPTDFKLRENDYVLGERKIGGNAQSITKNRWLHHTSVLWDYNPQLMQLLKIPEKRPDYRADRDHNQFLTTLKQFYPDKNELFLKLKQELAKNFDMQSLTQKEAEHFLASPHRKATLMVEQPLLPLQPACITT